jgi:hypothetical protein
VAYSATPTPFFRPFITSRTVQDMRLIDVNTIELKWFNDDATPEYAILSHTWGTEEISYLELVWINRMKAFTTPAEAPPSSISSLSSQDGRSSLMLAAMEAMLRGNWNPGASLDSVTGEDLLKRQGYSKILNSANEAKMLGFKYIWVDSVCINKESSAELQEAINSMYRWYRDAEVCLVYLDDVWPPKYGVGESRTGSEVAKHALETSRWRTRGWTLQELVAPIVCRFYFRDWTLLGEKEEYLQELSEATSIPVFVLEDRTLVGEVSIAERMSWASHRQTTRPEDLAYCLLGLFDIQMPLLYGEGAKAFTRLQEEILKTTDDYSIFAWRAVAADKGIYRGLLARSPIEFRDCQSFEREHGSSTFPISSSAVGLHLQLEFLPDPQDKSRVLAMVRSSNSLNQRLAIHLKCLDGDKQYARVDAGSLVPINDWPTGQLHTIYVRQKLSIPQDFTTPEFRCFHVSRWISNHRLPPVRIISAFPRELWNPDTYELRIPDTAPRSFGVLLLRVQSHTYAHSMSFPVAFGFDRTTCHYWCKIVSNFTSPEGMGARGAWQAVLKKEHIPPEVYDPMQGTNVRHDVLIEGDGNVGIIGINVSIRAGLCGDRIALQVHVDGLAKWQ